MISFLTQALHDRSALSRGGRQWQALALAALALQPLPGAASAEVVAQPTSEIADARSGTARRHYEVGPGPLQRVLSTVAGRAGVSLVFDPVLVEGLSSGGLTGEFTVDEAFAVALAGSGLQASPRAEGGYTLVRLSAVSTGSAAIVLPPVLVQGAAVVSDEDRPYTTAGSSTHLSRQHIERFRGTSVGDMFQGIPGVLIGENRNSGGLDVNIRGMQGQGRVPVLVDGARQETTVYRGYAGVASRSYIDPDLIGGVDIEKGPNMSAQGTGAVGGLVSMRTIGANDIVKNDDQGWGVRLRGTAVGNNTGSPIARDTPSGYAVGGGIFEQGRPYRVECQYDCSHDNPLPDPIAPAGGMHRPSLLDFRGWAGSLALAKRFDTVDLVAAYARRSQGSYFAGTNGPSASVDLSDRVQRGFWVDVYPKLEGASRFRSGERIANTQFASESTLLKSTFYLPHEQSLEVGYLRYESEYGELMPSALLRFGLVLQAPSSTVDADTWTVKYSLKPLDSQWLDLEANLWRTDTRSRNVNYPDALVELLPNLGLSMGTEQYERWGADLANTMSFNWVGPLQWRYGAALQLEDVRPHGEFSAESDSIRDGERQELSLFTALQWKPLPSLTLDLGLRYSDFSADDRSEPFIPDDDSTQCIDIDGDGACDQLSVHHTASSGSTPLASLTWEPITCLQFFALYAEALRMPSLFESTRGFSATQAFDVAIRPEHAYNREYGINLLRDGLLTDQDKLRIKASYFHNTVRDYLTRTSPNLWEESAYTAQLFTLRNIRKASFNGVELSVDYDAGPVFASLGGTRYTRIETCHYGSYRRYECTDYGVANSYINNMIPPKWHASAMLGARLFQRALTLGVRGTFMGERTRQPEFEDDTTRGFNQVVPWHDYTLVDLFGRYQWNKHFSVEFNVDNLTDQYYLDALSLGLVPAPGRSARLSFTLEF